MKLSKPLIKASEPFNVSILELTAPKLRGLGKIESLDYFDVTTGEFHDQGLFSIPFFGLVGDELRQKRYGYVDVKLEVFHPIIYNAIIRLRKFYEDLIAGKKYAVWNEQTKDFDEASPTEGQTGFHFFLTHWKSIEFKPTRSVERSERISLLKKYQSSALTRYIVVMPAGLRDLETGSDGRPVADEINEFYRKLISFSNTVPESALKHNPVILDTTRHRIQRTFNELYDYLEDLVKGKKKLFMYKFASRRVQNGTRNVITAFIPSADTLGEKGSVGINSTMMGIYQATVAIRPITMHLIQTRILAQSFISQDLPARLVNKKTLMLEETRLKNEDYDRWMTSDGLTKTLNLFANPDLRHKPVEVAGKYLALVYKGKNGGFKVFNDIRELPEHLSKKDVTPLTFCELLYIAVYDEINKYPVFITRYPVAGVGSIYPSFLYVKTTVKSEHRRPLDHNWEINEQAAVAYEFPVTGSVFYDTTTPHASKLGALGGDYDGDMVSATAVYSKEAVEEVTEFLGTRQAYIGTDGRFKFSLSIPPIELVLHNLTGD